MEGPRSLTLGVDPSVDSLDVAPVYQILELIGAHRPRPLLHVAPMPEELPKDELSADLMKNLPEDLLKRA